MASFAGSFLIKVFILHIGFELEKKIMRRLLYFYKVSLWALLFFVDLPVYSQLPPSFLFPVHLFTWPKAPCFLTLCYC